MTNVTITITDNIVNIANGTGADCSFEISKLLTTGVFDDAAICPVINGEDEDYTFTSDGLYRIWNPDAAEGTTIVITSDIQDHLEDDVKEVLLSDDINKSLPKGYDMVNLVLLSIMFIGNNAYQNVSYNAGYITDYTTIATVIDRTEKYFDRQDNTPQSTNKTWQ